MNVCLSSCGHLYHLQCLQQKDCVWGCASELQRQWRCYKCSAIHGGRVGPSTEPKRGRSTSLAQVCVCVWQWKKICQCFNPAWNDRSLFKNTTSTELKQNVFCSHVHLYGCVESDSTDVTADVQQGFRKRSINCCLPFSVAWSDFVRQPTVSSFLVIVLQIGLIKALVIPSTEPAAGADPLAQMLMQLKEKNQTANPTRKDTAGVSHSF